jgi:hypothetical protein
MMQVRFHIWMLNGQIETGQWVSLDSIDTWLALAIADNVYDVEYRRI